MNLASVRIITADIEGLIRFYSHVLDRPALRHTPDFAELRTRSATLAIGSERTLHFFGGRQVAQTAANRSAIIEFQVEDVDGHYRGLAGFLSPFLVQPPTLMPWGNKSLLFRDPDGNLVNLFTPATGQAIARFASQDSVDGRQGADGQALK